MNYNIVLNGSELTIDNKTQNSKNKIKNAHVLMEL